MSSQRILGFALLIVGVFLFAIGLNASNSVADQVTNTFLGRFSDSTMWYLIGGFAVGAFGFLLILFGFKAKRS
ncbi:MAG: DUF3185 family protein [Spirochaetales bacterium]|jgi:hypothetical protein